MKKLLLVLALVLLLTGCSKQSQQVQQEEILLPQAVEFTDKNIDLFIGESKALEYSVFPEQAESSHITFTSSNKSAVRLEGIVVTGISEGSSIISALCENTVIGQCVINVKQIEPERIWLNEDALEVKIGRSIEIEVHSFPSNITDTDYTFIVEDESIAEYSEGLLRGVATGETSIKIIHNTTGLSLCCPVSVTAVEAESMTINAESSLNIEEYMPLEVVFYPEDTTDQEVVWESSDESIASIEDAVLYAHQLGIVTVTATHGSGIIAQLDIEILPIQPKELILECEKGNKLTVGDKATITATIKPENTTDKTIIWTSSNESIATVNDNGVVKALSPGIVKITATLSNGSCVSYTFTINPKPVYASNGFIKKPGGERIAPVTINAPLDESCYVYFKHSSNSRYDFSIFVRMGTSVSVDVPLGSYTMYYATGQTWYGVDYRFGVGTSYYMSSESFYFYTSGDYVWGTEVTLYAVIGGNLETHEINESDFPG